MGRKRRALQQRKKQPAKADWLIMVYVKVDGWKSNFAIESLKQLKGGASAEVVVAAQLGVEASGSSHYKRYVFDGQRYATTSIEENRKPWSGPNGADMAQPKTLTAFIKWAREQRNARRCCLFLWMDGVLPLYEPLARRKNGTLFDNSKPSKQGVNHRTAANGTKRVRFIKPYELSAALRSAGFAAKGEKLQIIGMDACSMSMVEYAYELKDQAEYMVASEEAVPYWSFPYSAILKHFRGSGPTANVETICRAIAKDYKEAYQDCFCGSETGINPVMLSALRLGDQGIGAIASPLNHLTELMQSGANNGKSLLSKSILEARRNSQDFAFGTFVDLADFCNKLSAEENVSEAIKQVCGEICTAVKEKSVKANEVNRPANEQTCTGAMIYFPFFKENKQQDKIDVVLDKGAGSSSGDDIGKSAAGVSIATRGNHFALRQEVIKDIEGYYQAKSFEFENATQWSKFIQCVWSPILAKNEPWLLDLRYSAEQCAKNLANGAKRGT